MFEDEFSMKICIHNVDMEMFVLHELILYVVEDYFPVLLCIDSVDMEMFVSVRY